MAIRPMLAAQKYREAGDLWGPKHEAIVQEHIAADGYLIIQPKWDGFRMLHYGGIPMSRSGKPLANALLQKFVRDHPELEGLDGEILSGHRYDETSFRAGMSQIRSSSGAGDMTLVYYDKFDSPNGYMGRRAQARALVCGDAELAFPRSYEGDGYNVLLIECPQKVVSSLDEIYAYEQECLAQGFEGAIVRRVTRKYKHNRATALGGELVKVKRRETYDAIVVGYEERLQNGNEAKTSELGFTVRSAHQENLIPTGMLGALQIRFVDGPFAGVQQKVGVFRGLTHTDLRALWQERETLCGRYLEVSIDPAGGGYDSGRCPVFIKWRPKEEF